ncbi:GNAT family N-acetyltransferase [Panacibacter ginsenosidivorans]|uniref:GNAT family N-acetyltransferase n=1 Tax=Panacibacter ginsenosidivorans TaxID=1813871 RepID=A0A5B8V954_9BACT|nr:GNAT family N-acetyltransferase [Panacibacter ginsenosidivorans]QEC67882.1 GNAT family N-acetyltransferase [Panacibacter ginsenosidivorans]
MIALYSDAGLPRPLDNRERMQQMINNSSLFVSAWHNHLLVGLARSVTDLVWCYYLADLAVLSDYKKKGIGKELIRRTKEWVGRESMLLLLSVPAAMDYYPKIGFKKCDNSFIIHRLE